MLLLEIKHNACYFLSCLFLCFLLILSLGVRHPLTFHILIFSKMFSQMNRNLVGSSYGRSFRIAYFILIR
jgi:hypothetical protein